MKMSRVENEKAALCRERLANSKIRKFANDFVASRHLPIFKYANLLIIFCLLLTGCLRELSEDDPCETETGNLFIRVDIHWDGIPPQDKPPQGMAVHLFPWEGVGQPVRSLLPADGGGMLLPRGVDYYTMSYDYYGNENIYIRNDSDRGLIEAYSVPAGGLTSSGEPAVAEPYPYTFYVARNDDKFSVVQPPAGDTLVLHFYPHNVLREFTFLVYDVQGAAYISSVRGAVTGMAGAYRMAAGEPVSTPSTVIFGQRTGRVQWRADAQKINWTQSLLNSIFPGNANLQDWPEGWDDAASGWTGGWVMGTFCTFGPADIDNIRNILYIQASNTQKKSYTGYWGGEWEDGVREQIAGALGQYGTREEQLAWRRKNGGFDIILYNDGRLVVGPDQPQPGEGGGFDTSVDDFDNVDVPIGE